MSQDEYRANAAECQRMADSSLNPQDRRQWLKLAESWLRMLRSARGAASQSFDGAQKPNGMPDGFEHVSSASAERSGGGSNGRSGPEQPN